MDLMNKLSRKMGLGSDDDKYDVDTDGMEDEDEDIEDEEEEETPTHSDYPRRRSLGGDKVVDFTSVASLREQAHQAQQAQQAQAAAAQKTVEAMKVVVVEPKSFDDSQQISTCIMEKRPVVINFENTDTGIAHRIIDFMSGAVYALDGDIRKISRNVFLCAPNNVNVSFSDDNRSSFSDMTWMNK